jgi:hypothetical protein
MKYAMPMFAAGHLMLANKNALFILSKFFCTREREKERERKREQHGIDKSDLSTASTHGPTGHNLRIGHLMPRTPRESRAKQGYRKRQKYSALEECATNGMQASRTGPKGPYNEK